MVKVFSFVVLGAIQIGSLHLNANARALALQKSGWQIEYPHHSCACHCSTETATLRIWQKKDGPADRFAVKMVSRWFHALETFSDVVGSDSPARPPKYARVELLTLLGRDSNGVWALEVMETDGGAEFYVDLVCTTNEGKRKVLPVVKGVPSDELVKSSLASRVSRRLHQLVQNDQWDPTSLIPVPLPLLSKPPWFVFRPKHHANGMWNWTLSVRARDGRLVRIKTVRPEQVVEHLSGVEYFGGVTDDANGETWWILIKTEQEHNCSAQWHSIRLSH